MNENELNQLLNEGIVGPSISPWWAQALVTQTENHKRHVVIDYSKMINKLTN